jgi:hypothetical protein
LLFGLAGCGEADKPKSGQVLDEARIAGRDAKSFKAADEDYFRQMDSGVALTPAEVEGRNTWILWTAGNDRFWDSLSKKSVGTVDLLKTLSSHPNLKNFSRDNRWYYLGLVNEPCFDKAAAPDPQRFGLWLDKRRADCAADPFEDEKKYPGVKIRAARMCRPLPFTATPRASSVCGCFRIRTLTKPRGKNGTRSDFTRIRPITTTRT